MIPVPVRPRSSAPETTYSKGFLLQFGCMSVSFKGADVPQNLGTSALSYSPACSGLVELSRGQGLKWCSRKAAGDYVRTLRQLALSGCMSPTPSHICTQRHQSNPDYFYPEYLFTADGSVCLSHRQRIGCRIDFMRRLDQTRPFFRKRAHEKKLLTCSSNQWYNTSVSNSQTHFMDITHYIISYDTLSSIMTVL